MFTLKIKWSRFEKGEIVDESTLFIPADRVTVGGEITSLDQMKSWEEGSFMNYALVNDNTGELLPSRLIEVVENEKSTWYLTSFAWVLGPTGSTIERVAP